MTSSPIVRRTYGAALGVDLTDPSPVAEVLDAVVAAARDNGAAVFVDYAHKPGAVIAALQSLRPHVMGRIIVVIGAGGDRDSGKRPLMGGIAADGADIAIVTDDNPRSEDPAAIRAAIAAAAPGEEFLLFLRGPAHAKDRSTTSAAKMAAR